MFTRQVVLAGYPTQRFDVHFEISFTTQQNKLLCRVLRKKVVGLLCNSSPIARCLTDKKAFEMAISLPTNKYEYH